MAKTYSSKFNKSIRSENAGRSILEIIGVLAIVAVLSLVGLASLKTSKEKHQSNEILNDVSLAAFEVIDNMHAQIPEDGSEVNLDNLKFKKNTSYTFYAFRDADGTYAIVVKNIGKSLCSNLLSRENNRYLAIQTASEAGCVEGNNDVQFFINSGIQNIKCEEECGENEICGATGECLCKSGFFENESGECVKCECGSNASCDENGDCVCNDNYYENADGDCTACTCGANGECDNNGNCICDNGYTENEEGKCIKCSEPEGSCFIVDENASCGFTQGAYVTLYKLNDAGCVIAQQTCEFQVDEALEEGWNRENMTSTCVGVCDNDGNCSCPEGTHMKNEECVEDCKTCPEGQYCDDNTKECATCPEVLEETDCSMPQIEPDVCGNTGYIHGAYITIYQLNEYGCVLTQDNHCDLQEIPEGWSKEQPEATCESFCTVSGQCGCTSGTYYNGTECAACAEGCSACSAEACETCQENYYMRDGVCTPCGEFGTTPADNTETQCTCSVGEWDEVNGMCGCANGTYYDGTECVACAEGCSACSAEACETCQENYYMKDGVCTPCGEFGTTPADNTETQCTCSVGEWMDGICACATGSYYDGTECVTCLEGCFTCSSTETCDSCSANYYIKDSICVPCGEGGTTPEDNTETQCTCSVGEWDEVEGICKEELLACTSNEDCNGKGFCENSVCNMCEENTPYYIEATQSCVQCISDEDCNDNATCSEGFCLCPEGEENCNCPADQYFSLSTSCQMCIGCPDNAFCSGNDIVECQSGYIKNINDCFINCCKATEYFTGFSCQPCPDNATCDGTDNIICSSGRHINGTMRDENITCNVCEDGQYLSGSDCLSCVSNATCSKDVITCDTDYVGNELTTDKAACCHKTNEFFLNGECISCTENATCDGTDFICKEGLTKGQETCDSTCATDGSAKCSACNELTPFFNGTKCIACITDSNCGENHTCDENGNCLISNANCSATQFYYENGGECISCPSNAVCDGQNITCKTGYVDNRSDNTWWDPYYSTPCCSKSQYWNDRDMGHCYDCPDNANCDGTNNVSCKDGYVENGDYYEFVCCSKDTYFTHNYSNYCAKCPEHATCNGTYEITCDTGYHQKGDYWEANYQCVLCTEDSHCSAGQKCDTSTNNCVACSTDGSATCPTCTQSELNYWNGKACVRCITTANCDKNGTCTNNACTDQTQCNPGYLWREDWGECQSCPAHATCDGTDKFVCESGYTNNASSGDYWYSTPCCSSSEYWSSRWGEGYCVTCPDNASCDGSSDISCDSGYTRNEAYDGYSFCCNSSNEYFAEWYYECRTCPANATCNGTSSASCNDGYDMRGSVEEGNFYCVSCETNQFKAGSECCSCPANANCDGASATCNGDYILHNADTCQMACCHKTNEFLSNGTCTSCPANATCNGTDFTCNEGFIKDGNTCKITCATDGSATCSECNASTPYFNGTKCMTCVADSNCGENHTCDENGNCLISNANCSATQFYYEDRGSCYDCPKNATCNGADLTCKTGYVDNRSDNTWWDPYYSTPCCSKSQYWNDRDMGYCTDCPDNAICDGTSNVSCKSGYTKNDYYEIACCPTNTYFTGNDQDYCEECPEHATCNGTYEITCDAGYHLVGSYWERNYRCVPCTDNGHCSAGQKCDTSTYTCVSCATDGSTTCPTCTQSELNYWNGSSCVRCITTANCDKNGTCTNNACTDQTQCNPGYLWRENWGGCQSCPSYATCDGTDKYVCNSGYVDNGSTASYWYSTPCCSTSQFWSIYWGSEGSCSNCPKNARCNGTSNVSCDNNYVKNVNSDYDSNYPYCCHAVKEYFSRWYGDCRTCPANATCNGTSEASCNEGYEMEGYVEEGNFSCKKSS